MKKLSNYHFVRASVILLFASAFCSTLTAAPYATKLSNSSGTISFILNEAADNVKVVSSGGTVTNNLGALGKGLVTTNLGISGVFKVVVTRSGSGGYTQSSADTNVLNKFNSPRGVTVNRNPTSPAFGRIYVANSAAGTPAGRGAAIGDGIYMLNADQSDALNLSNTVSTAGIDFTLSTSDPQKIAVGPDDRLYINNFSTAAATTWSTDNSVSAGSSNQIFEGIGGFTNPSVHTDSANTPIIRGSLTGGDLVIYNIDGASPNGRNLIARWDILGGPLPFNSPPTTFASASTLANDLTCDLEIGPDGKFYTSVNRSAGTDDSSIKIFDTDATTLLWDSLTFTGSPDLLRQSRAIALSPDGKLLAIIHDTNYVSVIKLVNGLPDLSSRILITSLPATGFGRDLAFDVMGNIYTVSSGQALLRAFSVGGTTVATTGSDGTFTVVSPTASVSVTATDADASETALNAGAFTLIRDGDLSGSLSVGYVMSGLASNTADYTTLSGTAVFGPGANTLTLNVSPVDDSIAELVETVVLTINGNPNYTIGAGTATVTITDNETPELSITSTASTMYERDVEDRVIYQITRRGDTSISIVANITYAGTATGADYTGPSTVSIDPGTATQTFSVNPVDNNLLDGDRTVVSTIASGTGYTVGAPSSASATILDDERGPETLLFSDDFETNSAPQWQMRFAANNAIEDFSPNPLNFDFDYSADGVPAAPGGITTKGLKLTVNKSEASNFGAAGINVYPLGTTFSGNFALRFNVYIVVNSGAGTTEHALFGVNHSGNKTNWVRQSTGSVTTPATDIDGLWYAIVADGSDVNGFGHVLYTGTTPTATATVLANRSPTTLLNIFKVPPYYVIGGSPAHEFSAAETSKTWVDVDLSQVGNVLTCKINKTVIFQTTNTTAFTSGNIMLGYNDQFDSIGGVGAVYFDNVRVVTLNAAVVQPNITNIQLINGGTQVQIDFTGGVGDTTASFKLQSSLLVTGTYTDDNSAIITSPSAGTFRFVTSVSGATQFYRIRHL